MLHGRSKGVKKLLCLRLVLSQRRLDDLSLPQDSGLRLLPTRDDRLALRLVLRGREKACGADGLQLQKLIMQASLALGLVRHHDDELRSAFPSAVPSARERFLIVLTFQMIFNKIPTSKHRETDVTSESRRGGWGGFEASVVFHVTE